MLIYHTARHYRDALTVFLRFTRFVCPTLRFIPHEPRKKDTHSLYLQCFQQRPFLKFSEKSFKFSNGPSLHLTYLSLRMWFNPLPNSLLTLFIGNWTEKFQQGSTKEIWCHCKYYEFNGKILSRFKYIDLDNMYSMITFTFDIWTCQFKVQASNCHQLHVFSNICL